MAQKDHDDLADALAAMAAGHGVSPPPDHEEHAPQNPASKPPVAKPVVAKPPPARPIASSANAAPAAKPAAPQAKPPMARPISPGAKPPAAAQPAGPIPTPRQPTAQPAGPPANAGSSRPVPARAASPVPPAQPPVLFTEDEQEESPVMMDDDDAVIVPAPPQSAFFHTRPAKSARAVALRKLALRRTLIPIMLTLGVLFTGIGVAQWLVDSDFPFAARKMMPVAIALPVIGILLLGMCAMNMLYVRDMLAQADKESAE